MTLPTRNGRRRRRGIAVHRPRRALAPHERTFVDGIWTTTVARTLLDVAATEDERTLRRMIERSEELRTFDLRAVEEVLAEHAGRRSALRLARALLAVEPAPTRSELERLFLDLCRDHGLPRPAVNAVVAGLEVDFLWPEVRLVAETDGFATHGTRAAFERDRERDARLALAGFAVRRFTHRQVTRDAPFVAQVVAASLAGAHAVAAVGAT